MDISKELQVNEQIRDREVRLIDSNGDQLGILSAREAQKLAYDRQLDLVKVAPNARPPVCRIMDYGKYKYETNKKEKEAKKNQKVISIKEVRLSPTIEKHDLDVKRRNAEKFLKSGDKVKVSIRFRGRQLSHTGIGRTIMDKFAGDLEEVAVVEKRPKLEGKNMIMIMSPK
ncbi:MAG: translation initiation factor IF-3 [Firmicutes bacterium]|nr:translation initiation factor IF-3 [Bacillota bacterium]MDD3299061.1 translation initiation factor IF-3 [Bacillota bacterium]MDD4708379.1 translation initiation factor IF-3 [Bacillota bacterium]